MVSVVIPCYNVERCVGRAVRSVLAQSLALAEIVCVDDGSTDGTLEVLQELAEVAPSRLRVLSGPNRGAPAARNRGLAEASCEYVQFLDADDALDPDKLERQMRAAHAASPPADFVVGGYRRLMLDGSETVKRVAGGDDWINLFVKQLGITSANLWRRDALKSVGGWNEMWGSSQEYELMFRLLKHGARVAYDDSIATTLWEREGSISSGFSTPNRVRYTRLRVDALRHLEKEEMLVHERERTVRESTFTLVRSLYSYDAEEAVSLYRQAFRSRYVPPISNANTLPYVVAHCLLGFRGVERVRSLLKLSGLLS